MKNSMKVDFLKAIVMTLFLSPLAVSAQSQAPTAERRQAFHAAFEACLSENNIALAQGQRPSDAERSVIGACMKSKGFEHPGHQHKQRAAASVSEEAQ